ncbi:MAG: protein translocase subunit SecF [Myxococcota bacterium]
MEFIKPGTYVDFMRYRKHVIGLSVILVLASLISVFVPGPNYGIDFIGGTELQVRFKGDITAGEVRTQLEELGYRRPDVVSVEGAPNEYIVRVQEVTALPESQIVKMEEQLAASLQTAEVESFKVSPGGDKVSLQLSAATEVDDIRGALEATGVEVRSVNPFGKADDHRYEAHLRGVADEVIRELRGVLGERGPEAPRRVEWVGPKAGEQLRDAAIQSLLYAVAFIMVYVAFRFDLRFAPGGIFALLHDAIITVGIYVLVQKEVSLTTVAAILTIMGYSINDTIVVYDRIRENMSRLREKSMRELINVSSSQMLSRTIVTSGTTLLSVSAFFVWGTPVIQDIAFALFIGILIGTYSSIYISAPVTEWMDRRFFNRPES